MKRFLLLTLIAAPTLLPAQISIYQHGTVVRMHMGECVAQHRLMAALSGSAPQPSTEACPQYTLVADKVVYLIAEKVPTS